MTGQDPLLSLTSAQSRRDPYALYRLLRERAPVHWDEETNSWYVSRHMEVTELLLDRRLGAHEYPEWIRSLPDDERIPFVTVEDHLARWPVFSDRPAQVLLRRLIQPALNRTTVEALAPGIRTTLKALAAGIPAAEADLLRDFARPAAVATITWLLGIPQAAAPQLERWSDLLIAYLAHPGLDADVARAAQPAVEELTAFVMTELLPGTTAPVGLALARALRESAVEPADAVAMIAQLVTGGIEPTATATCVAALHHRPASSDPLRHADDIEIALRADPPFHFAPREAKTDFDYRGHHFAKGQRVVLILASAGHDGLDGSSGPRCPVTSGSATGERHVAFGRGRHYCLGAPLARLHLTLAQTALHEAGVLDRVDQAAVVREQTAVGITSFVRFPLRAARRTLERNT